MPQRLGKSSSYAYYTSKGGTKTPDEFGEMFVDFETVATRAETSATNAAASATSASESKIDAQAAATTATAKAGEATTAAQTATEKAASATASAGTATADANQARNAASTATAKASEASASATAAQTAKTDAVNAKAAAQAAQAAAETAEDNAAGSATAAAESAASVAGSAAQITQNTADIAQVMSKVTALTSDGVVPSAEQILTDKGVTDCVPYHYRKTGGDAADREYVDAIVGGTVNWNQLVSITSNNETVNGVTYTIDRENGTVTLAGTSTANSYLNCNISKPMVEGHKLYIRGCPPNGSAATYNGRDGYVAGDNNKDMGAGAIISAKSNSIYQIQVASGTDVTGKVFKPQIFDLTQMFGSTIADYIYQLEHTTAGAGVAFFKSLFPNDYYPYNAGELISVSGLSEHKMVGFNQFDKSKAVFGSFISDANGNAIEGANNAHSDYIDVIGGLGYYIKSEQSAGQWGAWYDSGKNFISGITGYNSVKTAPLNARYMRVTVLRNGSGNLNTFCVNISDPAKNGTHESYKEHSYPLDSTVELRGILKLDSNNKLYFDGDTYDADGKVTRRYGVVDLGTLDWQASSTANCFYSSNTLKYAYGNSAQMICGKYEFAGIKSASPFYGADKTIAAYYRGESASISELYVHDSAYSTVAAFKTAMSGVYLVYELATPTTEEADPYQHLQQCDPSGTEEYVSTGIVPIGHNSFYPENLRAKVEQLPWNFASLIAPTESAFVATRNYVTGELFIVNNVLYKATSNIANGGTITPNTNCTATTLAEIISALA